MENKFYVGQEVVAIKDHPQGDFKKGQEFIIQGIRRQPCCGDILIDIGVKIDYDKMKCSVCGRIYDADYYYSSSRFAPKQHLSNTTYNEVMEWIKKGNETSILN